MKTTIELPDDLFNKIKGLAAERSTTLKDVIVQALNHFALTDAAAEERKRKAIGRRLLKSLQASNTEPIVPLKREEIYDRGISDHP